MQGFRAMLHSHEIGPKDRSLNSRLFLGFPHYQSAIEEDEESSSRPMSVLVTSMVEVNITVSQPPSHTV